MKATGVVRKFDSVGRIVIPKEIRDKYGFQEGSPVEFFSDDNGIMLREYRQGCTFCKKTDNLIEYKGVTICNKCMEEIKSL